MAGIYIHIPFCKKACHYCNFHFSTSLKTKDQVLDSIIREIELSQGYLASQYLDSIYFGGGTPSLLTDRDLDRIMKALNNVYTWDSKTEITLEANPDDLHKTYIKTLMNNGINRLSIGVQSFDDRDLVFMNRAHNSREAHSCIREAQDAGIENISIDLIYGSQTTDDKMWEQNIRASLDLQVPHISAYCLTIEEGTALAAMVQRQQARPLDETKAHRQFHMLIDHLVSQGFEHYEISNFAHKSMYAVHNSNYWVGKPYLGLGPAAHSYNGHERRWNISHNIKYIDSIKKDDIPYQIEQLTREEQYNEYILVRIRTKWGCDLTDVKANYSEYESHFINQALSSVEKGLTTFENGQLVLTSKGKFIADQVTVDLMI